MSALSNKHVIVAMLIAPLLAVGTYYAIDLLVGEQPHVAEAGRDYPLVEMPGCRWDGGSCSLQNNDFLLGVYVEWLAQNRMALTIRSEFALQGIRVAVSRYPSDAPLPVEMTPIDGDPTMWSAELDCDEPESQRLRIVASAGESMYYGDASLVFTADEQPGRQQTP